EFYLNGKLQITVTQPQAAPTDPCANASEHWKSAEALGTLDAYQDHIARFPDCTFSGLAKGRIELLKNKTAAVAPPGPQPNDGGEGFSAWLSSAAYQKLFDDMVPKRFYPSIVEGRSSNGERQFRGKFVPMGSIGSFYSHSGITIDRFNQ